MLFLSLLLAAAVVTGSAQGSVSFQVQTSDDTVLLGNYLVVSFTLENASAEEFQPPVFEHFDVISGPNISSSFSMINGKVSQEAVYTYYIRPRDTGNYYIEPASVVVNENVFESAPVEIIVLPNPEGITQDPEPLDNFQFKLEEIPQLYKEEPPSKEKAPKKKKKTYKI